jgi:hypothetical protein
MRKVFGFGIIASTVLALAGCGAAGANDPDGDSFGTEAAALATTNDLTVSHIQRLPVLNWVQNSTNPTRDGWPTVGQSVTWRGVVKNFSSVARNNVQYRFFWDGTQIAQGTVNLPANGSVNVDVARTWDFNRHTLRLAVDTGNAVSEEEEQNNELTVFSNALSLGLWVEQGLYNHFLAHQRELGGAHSTCWENWAQRHVAYWNDVLFAGAISPDTPNGVLDRIRLDKITIVPDGTLPGTNQPDPTDRTVDLVWGYPSSVISGYGDFTTADPSNPFYFEGSLMHELGHARYLIDNYGFNVHQVPDGTQRDGIPHLENGAGIVGTPFLPMVSSDAVYYTHQSGLMSGEHLFMDTYGALAMNRIAGARAVAGNANAPGNLGIYLNDLPAQNQVTLLDAGNGQPLAGAEVRIYQGTGNGQLYGKNFSATASQTLTADAQGKVLVGRNPFTSGSISAWHENTLVLLRVLHQNRVRYVFMEASDFNMEYWRGHTALGLHTLSVAFQPGGVVAGGSGNPVLGFESTSHWTASFGTLATVSSPITQGAAALKVSNIGYATLTSAALSNQVVTVGNQVKLDLLLPQQQPQSWHGQVSVFLSAPSKNLYNAPLGTVELTGLPLETYNTITIGVPGWIKNALTGSFSDLKVTVALNVASGSGRHLVDNFRFLP